MGRSRGMKIALVVGSVVATVAVLEILVHVLFVVSDVALSQHYEGLGARPAPNQSGTHALGMFAEVRGRYRINGAGWNSPHEYEASKQPGRPRIAVIGDSLVEAIEVDVERSFPYVLEGLLAQGSGGTRAGPQVYSFGHGGASLAQYLNIMRYVAQGYAPDFYIIDLTHNDFLESLEGFGSIYQLNFREVGPAQFVEVPPAAYQPSRARRTLVWSALVRFCYGNLQVKRLQVWDTLFKKAARAQQADIRAPVPDGLMERVRRLTKYLFGEYQQIARRDGARLLLVMGADVPSIQPGLDPRRAVPYQYNRLVGDLCRELGLECIDLTEDFLSDFREKGGRFNFRWDDVHWNERGHRLVAESIATWVRQHWLRDG